MVKFLKQHAGSMLLSVLLHVALMGMLAITVTFSKPKRTATRLAIEATVVDPATLPSQRRRQEELQRQREAARQQRQRQQELAAQREAEELEQQKAEQVRQQKLVDDKRKAEAAAKQKAADDKRKAEAAAKQKAADDKRKAEEAAKKKAADAKRKAEEAAKRKQQEEQARQEKLLREELAREEELLALQQGPLMSRYQQQIKNRIERNWIRPPNAQEKLNCDLKVTQTRNGDVIDVRVLKCDHEAAVVRTLEDAALRATPLPKPPDPRLFARELILEF